MADTYTAKEIDDLLNNLKKEMLSTIDNTIVRTDPGSSTVPSGTETLLWLKTTERTQI